MIRQKCCLLGRAFMVCCFGFNIYFCDSEKCCCPSEIWLVSRILIRKCLVWPCWSHVSVISSLDYCNMLFLGLLLKLNWPLQLLGKNGRFYLGLASETCHFSIMRFLQWISISFGLQLNTRNRHLCWPTHLKNCLFFCVLLSSLAVRIPVYIVHKQSISLFSGSLLGLN